MSIAEPIKTKSQMYRLWNEGIFGNKPQAWHSYREYQDSGFPGPIMLRYKEPGSRFCSEITPHDKVAGVMTDWLLLGADLSKVTFGEAILSNGRIFQGEICRSEKYLELWCSYLPEVMRKALALGGEYYRGIEALLRLRGNMPPEDIEWLWYLWEKWPDAVIEFSVFNRRVGVLNSRTIIWECREY